MSESIIKEQKIYLKGNVSIFLNMSSWMLSLGFEGVGISKDFISIRQRVEELDFDINEVLSINGVYDIQINHTDKEMVFPISKLRITDILRKKNYYEIQGTFVNPEDQLLDNIDKLKRNPVYRMKEDLYV